MTTPHACAYPEPAATTTNSTAGIARPASAAKTGTLARRQLVSSPIANSRRTSSPTVKKKIAISASFTSACSVKSMWMSPSPIDRCVSQNDSYAPSAMFAHAMATTVAIRSRSAPERFMPIAPILAAIEACLRERAEGRDTSTSLHPFGHLRERSRRTRSVG